MGQEIDLMHNYPKTKRDVSGRGHTKTEADRAIARKFGKEFFDGTRDTGYGGFKYMPRFWQPVIPDFAQHFSLDASSHILDVGCAKGFMLYDFKQLIPGIQVSGLDISEYAIENALEAVKPDLVVGSATELPYENNTFDALFSITTLHNLEVDDLAKALIEIERVLKQPGKSFITVDAYRNDEEKERMEAWNLTAKTMMHVDEWKAFFKQVGYTGDYYWFIP
ncbi:class I SAM-dependent methyltransferase [Catenovulum sediminis]|uniref:class I SAM-dependent methyltransferase n=1 Tax=Catenovulum sediminis TaxID=1740262 RepID=UPI00118065CD|nr:class I SAM-dependent methyltransferase [Catenovulum sediminis]